MKYSKRIKSYDPATGELLGEVLLEREPLVKEKVQNAKTAFQMWSSLSFKERAEYMMKIKKLMIEKKDEIIKIIVKETGKPILEAMLHDLHFPLEDLEYFSKNTENFLQDEQVNLGIAFRGKKSKVTFEPAGVIGIIVPWNFPILLCFHSMVPALMAGNTVIIKPSEYTPLCTLKIGELIKEAGLPSNVVNILTGDGLTGQLLVESDVDRIIFVGSVETGKQVMKTASQKLHPVVLELGGKDPAIVCEDTHLDRTISGILWNSLYFTGQSCSSIERVYVMQEIANGFIDALVQKTEQLKVGNGFDHKTDIGPLIAEFQLKTIEKHIKDAVEKGATILTGGKQLSDIGNLFYSPTVLTDVNHDMLIMKEETFGPIIPIMVVNDDDEAIRLANDTPYGLTASIWTADWDRGERIAKQLHAGYLCINNRAIENPSLPWGGIKSSGFGRISSRYGLLHFVNMKCVTLDKSHKKEDDWWFPYSENKLQYYDKILGHFHSGSLIGKLKATSILNKGIEDDFD